MEDTLSDLFERAEAWPQAAKDELLRVAAEIENKKVGLYILDENERVAVEIGLEDIITKRFADETDIALLFAKCRN